MLQIQSSLPNFYPSPSSPKPKSLHGNLTFRRPIAVASATVCATSSSETTTSSLYEVLGIPFGATGDEIKAAYRRLARSCHPDVAVVATGGERKSAVNEFIKVHDAYSTLSDPEKRADYDRRLCRRIGSSPATRSFAGVSASPNTSSFYRSPRRNWETDQCW